MRLIVSKESADADFVYALIDRMNRELYILLDANKRRIDMWQDYINKNIKLFSYSLDYIDLTAILKVGIENITAKESQYNFIVEIDDKKFISGVYVSIESICRLVNYGNLALGGIHIFSDVFDSTRDSLSELEELYYSGEMI